MREAFKFLARGVTLVAAIPSLASYFVRAGVMGADRALEGSTQFLSLIAGVAGQSVRRAFPARTRA